MCIIQYVIESELAKLKVILRYDLAKLKENLKKKKKGKKEKKI